MMSATRTVTVALPVPPSSSVTLTVIVYAPGATNVWLPEQEPPLGMGVVAAPSPQFTEHECVSFAPGSVKVENRLTEVPATMSAPFAGAEIAT